MLIADSQIHTWAPNSPERPWFAGAKPQRATPADPEQLLREMDEAGVERAVLVPPRLDCNRNDLALAASRKHPKRFITMGRLDLNAPEARRAIATWHDQPGMAGLRCPFHDGPWARVIGEGGLDWLWTEAERTRMPMMFLITDELIPVMDHIAQKHPGLRFALDHLALDAARRDEDAFRVIPQVAALARHPNISVKVSALSTYTTDKYPFEFIHPYLRMVYDAFGPRRMFWGSDLTRLNCSYRQAVTMFTEHIPWLTSEDKQWIMGRALCDWLEWS